MSTANATSTTDPPHQDPVILQESGLDNNSSIFDSSPPAMESDNHESVYQTCRARNDNPIVHSPKVI